jgi:GT2 family glycosyltransferase
VDTLQRCLQALPPSISYGVVVNDHCPGEPVDQLAEGASLFLANDDNPGYGRAINQAVRHLKAQGLVPDFLGVLNTDLSWIQGTFSCLLAWMAANPDVVLAVPQLCDSAGRVQQLCKQNPTLLALFSRRFLPEGCKPGFLRRYDRWYVMADRNYQQVFDVPYLSGCCMLIRYGAFHLVGGFDERFFLYLEDADITRSLAQRGRTVHLPVATVTHNWGRGNHRSKRLTLVNLHSAWLYFRKWGWRLW